MYLWKTCLVSKIHQIVCTSERTVVQMISWPALYIFLKFRENMSIDILLSDQKLQKQFYSNNLYIDKENTCNEAGVRILYMRLKLSVLFQDSPNYFDSFWDQTISGKVCIRTIIGYVLQRLGTYVMSLINILIKLMKVRPNSPFAFLVPHLLTIFNYKRNKRWVNLCRSYCDVISVFSA